MSGIKFLKDPSNFGKKLERISSGNLKANVDNPVVAKLVLSIPQGEYINREIISRIVLYQMAEPESKHQLNFDEIYYTLGDGSFDKESGFCIVPYTIYVPVK